MDSLKEFFGDIITDGDIKYLRKNILICLHESHVDYPKYIDWDRVLQDLIPACIPYFDYLDEYDVVDPQDDEDDHNEELQDITWHMNDILYDCTIKCDHNIFVCNDSVRIGYEVLFGFYNRMKFKILEEYFPYCLVDIIKSFSHKTPDIY